MEHGRKREAPHGTRCESPSVECDLVLVGGRVVDPASGFDAVANVGITGGRISVVTTEPVRGRTVLDVGGRVVAPGWIDLHSHAQTVAGSRLQAHDGVTTALDLEAGALDLDEWHARAGREGRATSYGCSAAWQQARMVEVGGLPVTDLESSLEFYGDPGWKAPATARQREAILARVGAELAAGAIGVGVLQGYAPGSTRGSTSPSPGWPPRPTEARSPTPGTWSSSSRTCPSTGPRRSCAPRRRPASVRTTATSTAPRCVTSTASTGSWSGRRGR